MSKKVYMCFSTDIIHNGHIKIIGRAAELGELTVGVLTDEVIARFKRYPLIPLEERMEFSAISKELPMWWCRIRSDMTKYWTNFVRILSFTETTGRQGIRQISGRK